ncbi:MAG: hypothetical protein ABII26_10455 [Pseudomonadota bacterium]
MSERLEMNPVLIEVVTPMISSVEMNCRRCNLVFDYLGLQNRYRNDCAAEYPEEWKEAVGYVAGLINGILKLYRHRVRIRVIDAQSPLGLWKQIRHRVFRFPAFVIDKKSTYIGWDPLQLEALIDERIHSV